MGKDLPGHFPGRGGQAAHPPGKGAHSHWSPPTCGQPTDKRHCPHTGKAKTQKTEAPGVRRMWCAQAAIHAGGSAMPHKYLAAPARARLAMAPRGAHSQQIHRRPQPSCSLQPRLGKPLPAGFGGETGGHVHTRELHRETTGPEPARTNPLLPPWPHPRRASPGCSGVAWPHSEVEVASAIWWPL